jgi:hypothetical protein
MMLPGDAAIPKVKEDSGVIADLAVRRKIVQVDRADPGPVHLQGNLITLGQNIRDRIGLPLKQNLSSKRAFQSFVQIRYRSARGEPVWHFRD